MFRKPLVLPTLLATFAILAAACTPQPPEETPGTGGKPGAGGSGGRPPSGTGGGNGGTGTGGGGGSMGGTGGATPDAGNPDTTPPPPDMSNADCGLLCKPNGKMPASIKDTKLFPAGSDFAKRAPRLIEFVPDPPLWSDGMEKQRFLLLPEGEKVDNTDRKAWKFPVGTIMTKTFFDDTGAGGKPRAIETRFIRVGSVLPFEYYVYHWNKEGTDATLVVDDIEGDPNKDVTEMITINRVKDGMPFTVNGGKAFPHTLPSRNACGQCHEEHGNSGQGPQFIGFDELRLNAKFPATAAKTQLQEFADKGVFKMPIPADPAKIEDPNPVLLRIKRWVAGNCVHCHYGEGQFDLRPDVFVKNTVGVAVPETQSVKPPPGMLRVWQRDIRKSVLYVQVERTMLPPPVTQNGMDYRLRPMPPVGVHDLATDQAALADLRTWINSLPPR